MTQEEKELLLKDLCARFPYEVMVECSIECGESIDLILSTSHIDDLVNNSLIVKPYLRPMSSITKEEKEELKGKCLHTETEEDWEGVRDDVWGIQILDKYDTRRWDNPIWASTINMDAIDWLNANHFDYRGLIPMGLALEAPEGMYQD